MKSRHDEIQKKIEYLREFASDLQHDIEEYARDEGDIFVLEVYQKMINDRDNYRKQADKLETEIKKELLQQDKLVKFSGMFAKAPDVLTNEKKDKELAQEGGSKLSK